MSLPKHFHKFGIGFRQLSLLELRKMFSFSKINKHIAITMNYFTLLPLQLMDMLLQPTISIITNTIYKHQIIQIDQDTNKKSLPDISKHISYD